MSQPASVAAPVPPPLHITQVSVGRVLNLGNYENRRCDATALVGEHDDPAAIVTALIAFVGGQLGVAAYPSAAPNATYAPPDRQMYPPYGHAEAAAADDDSPF